MQKQRPALLAVATPFLTVTTAIAGARIVLNFRSAFAQELQDTGNWKSEESNTEDYANAEDTPVFSDTIPISTMDLELQECTRS